MESKKFKLIEGNFSAEEAGEILRSLYMSKINFHEMKNFSSNERFGKDDAIARDRLPSLRQNLTEIMEVVEAARATGKGLIIKAEIEVASDSE
ncbi:hypothetical protein GC194_08845 [bacterium]|nr:hypothetical protein [bacterium]